MAKRVFVQGICDICGTEYRDGAEGFTYIIDDGSKTAHYEIDLCPTHVAAFNDNFVQYARVVTKKREKKAAVKTDGPYLPKVATDMAKNRPLTVPCDQKGCDYMGADNRAVGVHKRREHGIEGGKK